MEKVLRFLFIISFYLIGFNAIAEFDKNKPFISETYYQVKTQESVSLKKCLQAVKNGKIVGKMDNEDNKLGNVYYVFKDYFYDVSHYINYKNLLFTFRCRRAKLPS